MLNSIKLLKLNSKMNFSSKITTVDKQNTNVSSTKNINIKSEIEQSLSENIITRLNKSNLLHSELNDKKVISSKIGFDILSDKDNSNESVIDLSNNTKAEMLLINKKIDFNSIEFKRTKNIYEGNLGFIKAAHLLNDSIKQENVHLDQSNEYKLRVVGKELSSEEIENNLHNSYLKINEESHLENGNVHHYISTNIFKDNTETSYIQIDEDKSILKIIMSNPLLLLTLSLLIYYLYPKLWRKTDWSNLSLRRNNFKILNLLSASNDSNSNKDIYEYINYRRGLYCNVRANFK